MDPDQDFIVLWGGLCHLFELQDIWCSVFRAYNCFHVILQYYFSRLEYSIKSVSLSPMLPSTIRLWSQRVVVRSCFYTPPGPGCCAAARSPARRTTQSGPA